MNRYFNPNTLQIMTESQLRSAYPNTCFPIPFSPPAGWHRLHEPTEPPVYDPIRQQLIDQSPVYENGTYRAVYTVSNYPSVILEQRLAAEVKRLEVKIDGDVDTIYAKVIGNRTVEYQMAYEEAKAWVAGGYEGDPPPSVQSHVEGYGISPEASAAEIIAVGDAWYGLVRLIRSSRLKAKGLARQHRFQEAEAFWNGVMAQVAAAT